MADVDPRLRHQRLSDDPYERGFQVRGCWPDRCQIGVSEKETSRPGVRTIALLHVVDGVEHRWEVEIPRVPPHSLVESWAQLLDREARTTMTDHHARGGLAPYEARARLDREVWTAEQEAMLGRLRKYDAERGRG